MAAAGKAGITTVVDPQSYLEDLEVYSRLRHDGRLPARLQVALFHRPRGTTQETLKLFDDARQKYNDDWLRVSAVKLYIDDVIEPHTAALLEPYADRPETRGELDYPPDEFSRAEKNSAPSPCRFEFEYCAISKNSNCGSRGGAPLFTAFKYSSSGRWELAPA